MLLRWFFKIEREKEKKGMTKCWVAPLQRKKKREAMRRGKY